ncbi:MAG: large conductance mechanosensitive channel protein MscL [Bacilli bacterium]
MAVGVIIGGAFGKIVSSLVNDVLMPFVGILLGGIDFSKLSVTIGSAKILYGSFIQTIIDFLIIAFCIFVIVKLFEKFKKKEEVSEVKKNDEIVVLEEIRDLLKKDK